MHLQTSDIPKNCTKLPKSRRLRITIERRSTRYKNEFTSEGTFYRRFEIAIHVTYCRDHNFQSMVGRLTREWKQDTHETGHSSARYEFIGDKMRRLLVNTVKYTVVHNERDLSVPISSRRSRRFLLAVSASRRLRCYGVLNERYNDRWSTLIKKPSTVADVGSFGGWGGRDVKSLTTRTSVQWIRSICIGVNLLLFFPFLFFLFSSCCSIFAHFGIFLKIEIL